MSKRHLFLVAVALVGVLAGWAWSRVARTPVAGPRAAAAPVTSLRTAGGPGAHGAVRPRSDSHPAAAERPLPQLAPEEVEAFNEYRRAIVAFSSDLADRLGLTKDQQNALRQLAWDYRQRLNQLISDTAVASEPSPGEVVLAFRLDQAQVSALRSGLYRSARDVIGDEKWPAVQRSRLMTQLEEAMEFWGQTETAYSFKRVVTPNGTTMVTVDVVRATNPPGTACYQHRLDAFRRLYGPIARRIGF